MRSKLKLLKLWKWRLSQRTSQEHFPSPGCIWAGDTLFSSEIYWSATLWAWLEMYEPFHFGKKNNNDHFPGSIATPKMGPMPMVASILGLKIGDPNPSSTTSAKINMINRWISMKWPIFGGLNHHILADLGDPQIFATHFSSTLLQLGPKKKSAQGKFAAGRFSSNWAEICEPSKIWHVSEWTPQRKPFWSCLRISFMQYKLYNC